jgi:hypothetical protein
MGFTVAPTLRFIGSNNTNQFLIFEKSENQNLQILDIYQKNNFLNFHSISEYSAIT